MRWQLGSGEQITATLPYFHEFLDGSSFARLRFEDGTRLVRSSSDGIVCVEADREEMSEEPDWYVQVTGLEGQGVSSVRSELKSGRVQGAWPDSLEYSSWLWSFPLDETEGFEAKYRCGWAAYAICVAAFVVLYTTLNDAFYERPSEKAEEDGSASTP